MQVEFADDPNKSKKENRQAKREFMKAQRELNRNSDEAKKNWNTLKSSKNVHTIHINEKNSEGKVISNNTVPKAGYTKENGGGTDIYIDTSNTKIQGEELNTNIVAIGHEEGHAFRFDQGLVAEDYKPNMNDPDDFNKSMIHLGEVRKTEEIEASHIENIIRAQIDPTGTKIPLRKTYNNIPVYVRSPLNNQIKPTTVSPNVIKQGYDYYKKP